MSGVAGKSGRKKNISTLVRIAIDSVSQDLPLLFDSLTLRAKEGDREAAIYLIDRVLGKPKQSTELDIKDKERIGVGFLVELTALIAASRRDSSQGYMLEEGNYATEQRGSQGVYEAEAEGSH